MLQVSGNPTTTADHPSRHAHPDSLNHMYSGYMYPVLASSGLPVRPADEQL